MTFKPTDLLPGQLFRLIKNSLAAIKDGGDRLEIEYVAYTIAATAWNGWISGRLAEDNRPEHEFVVFHNILRIAESEGLSLSEKRIATAFAFLHDSSFIHRVTEREIQAAPSVEAKTRLQELKIDQRRVHMERGAVKAFDLLATLGHPTRPNEPILARDEVARCVEIVGEHDSWKLGRPHPLGTDRLAVVCLEADALWPLHPLGVLADLERPNGSGAIVDAHLPAAWTQQVRHSFSTLSEYRKNWNDRADEAFVDHDTVFRTPEGHRIYSEWRAFWKV